MGNKTVPAIKMNFVDRLITAVNPSAGLQRVRSRALIQAASATGYLTFGSPKRTLRGAQASLGSADSDTCPKLSALRMSSRDLYMNSPLATAAIDRCETNIVGYGLSLQSRIDRNILGLSDEQAEAWERNTEREFAMWARSKECDASRSQCFYDMQALVMSSTLLSGDVFAMLPYIERKNSPYKLALKIIEADLVSNPNNAMDSNKIAGGVEFDADGAPVKYHVQKSHPGDFHAAQTWIPVDAYGEKSGRRNVLHLYKKTRPGQHRGIPLLAPVIEILKMISRLSEAELTAAVITSFFTVFVKGSSDGVDPLQDGFASSQKVTDPTTDQDKNTYEMGSGNVIGLADGEDITMADPKRPNAAFDPFFQGMVRQIGAAVQIPFEVLLLHFTASYSASRAALLQGWKFFLSRRVWLKREFCAPVFEEWLFEAISIGRISAPGFFLDPAIRAAWSGSDWDGPGMGQLDPVRETEAALARIKGNLSTYAKETAALDGDNWDEVIVRRDREEKIVRGFGLEEKQPAYKQAADIPQQNGTEQ
jgi:lambda family phage portal protein